MSFQEFISTLDDRTARKLCIQSLCQGVGSMDYIHSLLIAGDDLDDLNKEGNAPVMTESEETEQSLISASSPQPGPSSRPSMSWCKCRVCEIMPQEIQNKCSLQHKCMTTHSMFQNICLDPNVLQLAIRNRGDVRNDREDNST